MSFPAKSPNSYSTTSYWEHLCSENFAGHLGVGPEEPWSEEKNNYSTKIKYSEHRR